MRRVVCGVETGVSLDVFHLHCAIRLHVYPDITRVAQQMTFRTRPSTYRITLAPTNRAKCRKCKQILAKGSPRITTTAFVMPGRSTVFARCAPRCVDAKFAAAVLAVYKSAARVPSDPTVAGDVAKRVRSALESHHV